ncbi:hypothetical protein KA005_30415, partial [bacterium]|nr:hypothetical protein [bacterium]
KIIGLKKAVHLKDKKQSVKLVEQLRGSPRFEMQASLIAAKFAWDQGRYDIGMLQLLPITKKIPQNTFPQLHKMLKKFYLEAVRRGQIKVK